MSSPETCNILRKQVKILESRHPWFNSSFLQLCNRRRPPIKERVKYFLQGACPGFLSRQSCTYHYSVDWGAPNRNEYTQTGTSIRKPERLKLYLNFVSSRPKFGYALLPCPCGHCANNNHDKETSAEKITIVIFCMPRKGENELHDDKNHLTAASPWLRYVQNHDAMKNYNTTNTQWVHWCCELVWREDKQFQICNDASPRKQLRTSADQL